MMTIVILRAYKDLDTLLTMAFTIRSGSIPGIAHLIVMVGVIALGFQWVLDMAAHIGLLFGVIPHGMVTRVFIAHGITLSMLAHGVVATMVAMAMVFTMVTMQAC